MVKKKQTTQATLNTAMVSTESIKVTGLNPRKDFDKKLLKELAQSIAEMGILEPLIVRQKGNSYELVSGERRLRAAKIVGLKEVPVWIREVGDSELQEIMILENLQRESLSPLEEGMALASMVEQGANIADLAKKLGKSDNWVRGRINLLMVPEEMKNLLAKGMIPISAAMDLVPFAGSVFAEKVAQTLDKNHYDKELPYTQDSVKRAMDDIAGREPGPVLNFNHLKNNYIEWHKHFDKSDCAKCQKKVKHTHGYRGVSELCIDKECFGPKVKEAKLKIKDKEAKAASKSDFIDLNNARNWEDMARARFSTAVCNDCDFKKKGVQWGSKMTVCTKSACFKKMASSAQKILEKRIKKLTIDSTKAAEEYIQKTLEKPLGLPRVLMNAFLLGYSRCTTENASERIKRSSDKWKKNKEKGMKFLNKLSDAELERGIVKMIFDNFIPEHEHHVRNNYLPAFEVLPEVFGKVVYNQAAVVVEPTGKKTKADKEEKKSKPKK